MLNNRLTIRNSHTPAGDQPVAIAALVKGLEKGMQKQTLLGATGTGKTFTMANVIEKIQKPTLVIAHNKTLAAQLAQEFTEFFPDAAVHYFVSYYDYYQPEAYMPMTDTYIEKDAQINEEIDRLRHASTQALLTRTDAQYSNFFGSSAGRNASGADGANFFGRSAGYAAAQAYQSNFIGGNAGYGAVNAFNSNFFGSNAGSGAIDANNSIIIGVNAGLDDTVDNSINSEDFSILIGNNTSTGGFSNSIAIGGSATNTASNQFMIGSTTRPINETRFQGSVIGTQCTITTGTGIACTSDERLKENIIDLSPTVLEDLMNIKTVHYNLISDTTHKPQIGFLAQNLEQYFPELVDTDRNSGFKSVYYAQMTPILVEAIREMNLKITDINNIETSNTWRDALIAWFENTGNGIRSLVVHDKICVDDQCLTKDDIKVLLEIKNANVGTSQNNSQPVNNPLSNSDPVTCTAPQVLNETGDACIDPVSETPSVDAPVISEPTQ